MLKTRELWVKPKTKSHTQSQTETQHSKDDNTTQKKTQYPLKEQDTKSQKGSKMGRVF